MRMASCDRLDGRLVRNLDSCASQGSGFIFVSLRWREQLILDMNAFDQHTI